MNSESNYIKTLDKVVSKLKRMHEQADAVRWLYDNGDVEGSYRHALKLEEIFEETVLLARVLPAYTGAANALSEVETIISTIISVKIGYTAEGWFSVRIPALLPKKAY